MRQEIAQAQGRVARIAARQHGVVSLEQLTWAGLSASTVSRRVREGWLHRVHRGVYAVGHRRLSEEGWWMAAVLALSGSAVLSHESAAKLWGISPSSPPLIHVTVPERSGRARRPGIRLHHSTTLAPSETTRRRNIPVTTQARTRRDLGYGGAATRSGLERLFLRICRRHRIPSPEVNGRVGRYRPDFLWRAERLIVEVDGYAYHSDREAFRSDRARDRSLAGRGFTVLRFSDDELAEQPELVAVTVLARLQSDRDRL